MSHRRDLLPLLAILSIAATQTPPASPPGTQIEVTSKLAGRYGDPEQASVEAICRHPELYQLRMVRTQGLFEEGLDRGDYRLREGQEELLLLPVVAGPEVEVLLGRRVEVVGVVRRIRRKEYLPDGRDMDTIEDPYLPVLPAPDTRLPRLTLSFLSIFDATPLARRAGGDGGGALRALLADPGSPGRPVRVLGQFRGANLFGDLPDLPGRDAHAFVLKEGDAAVWVIGRGPEGKGFRLDPRLKGDSRFWLEVEGRLEPCAGQSCLRARRIQLATSPTVGEAH
jgi:hypothetical protein